MALIPSFCVTQQPACKYLSIEDLTGTYDSTYNTGGYGTPNPELSDVNDALLTVTLPDGTVKSNLSLISVNIPNTDGTLAYITNSDLGLGTLPLPNGIYSFKFDIIVGSDTYTDIVTILVDCQAQCCVDKLFAKVELSTCDCCQNDKLAFAETAQGWLDAANHAFNCSKPNLAIKLLKKVEQICAFTQCQNC